MLIFVFCQNLLFFFFNIIIFPDEMLFHNYLFIVYILVHCNVVRTKNFRSSHFYMYTLFVFLPIQLPDFYLFHILRFFKFLSIIQVQYLQAHQFAYAHTYTRVHAHTCSHTHTKKSKTGYYANLNLFFLSTNFSVELLQTKNCNKNF